MLNIESTSPYSLFKPGAFFVAFFLLSFCSTVSAETETVISDNFTDINGKTLGLDTSNSSTNEHNPYVAPNVDLPGNPYTYNNQFNHNPITVQGNEASISAGAGGSASIDINSKLGYIKPIFLTISAELEPNDISTAFSFNKLALGFYSAPQAAQSFEGFLGLALSSDGTLSLIGFDTADFNTTVDETQAYSLGTFDPTAFHKVTYTVDTATGMISGATLTDALGTETYNFSTDLFTSTQTSYAGFYARSGTDPSTAYVDDFSLTGIAIPEPSTFALMAAGLVSLAFIARRRHGLTAFRG